MHSHSRPNRLIHTHSGRLQEFALANPSKLPPITFEPAKLPQYYKRMKTSIGQTVPAEDDNGVSSSLSSPVHGAPEVIGVKESGDPTAQQSEPITVEEIDESKQGWIAYLTTRNFYIVLVLG